MAPHTLSSHLLADYSLLHCPSAAVVASHDHRHHLRRHRATSAASTRLVRGAEVSAPRGDEEPVGEDGPPTNGGFFAPPPPTSLFPQWLLLLLDLPAHAVVVALLVRQGREGVAAGRLDAFATASAASPPPTPLAVEEEERGGEE